MIFPKGWGDSTTDKVKLQIEALRWAHSHHDCSDGKMECPVKNECFRSDSTLCNLCEAADLIESLVAELEEVEQERDGLSIMLASAISAAHTFKRKLEEAEHKNKKISPLVMGRMNGRHDGYNVLFSAIDEMPEKPCYTCVNRDWDMPQCRECNSTNNFRWYVKEET